MGAETNQDFVTYRGDDVEPIFTVRDSAGTVIDISTVSEITWVLRRNLTDAVLLTKTKTGGDITFVTDGTNGQFQVDITSVDTAALTGFYIHQASITDSLGNVTTVTVGRMQVGVAPPWTYDATQLGTSTLYQVRRLIGDVLQGEQQLADEEINFAITLNPGSIFLAAAEACRLVASQNARKVDLVQGELKTNYSNIAKAYSQMAVDFTKRAMTVGVVPYVGGISVADKNEVAADPDRVQPSFNIGMDDNLLPPGPYPNQVPGASEVS